MSIINNFTPSNHIITNRLPHLYSFGCTAKPFGKPIIFFKENNIDYCFGQLNPGNASGTHLGLINLTDNIVEFTSEWYPMLSVSPDDPNFTITNLRDNENHAYDEMTLAPDGFSDFSLILYNDTKYILCIGTYERNSDNIYNGSALLYNISTRKIDNIIASNYLQELITTKKISFLEENDAVFNNISENSYETYSNSNSNLKLTLELEIDDNDKKWYYILNNGSRMTYTDSENQVYEVCFYFDDKVFGFNNNVNSKYSSYYGEPFLFFNKNSETYAIFSGIDKDYSEAPWVYIVNCKTKELTIKKAEDFIMNNHDHLQDIFIPSGYTLSEKDKSSYIHALTCFALVQYNNKTYISALSLYNKEYDMWYPTFRFLIDIETFEFTYVIGTESTAEITLLPNIKTVYDFDNVNRIFEYSNESNEYTVKSKIREGQTVTNLRYDELLSNEYVQVVTETEQAVNIIRKQKLISVYENGWDNNDWLNQEFMLDDKGYWLSVIDKMSNVDSDYRIDPKDIDLKPLIFKFNNRILCVANVIKTQNDTLSNPPMLALIDIQRLEILKIYKNSGDANVHYNFSGIYEYNNEKYIKFDMIQESGSEDKIYKNVLVKLNLESNEESERRYTYDDTSVCYISGRFDESRYSYGDARNEYGHGGFYQLGTASEKKNPDTGRYEDYPNEYHLSGVTDSDLILIESNDTLNNYSDDIMNYYFDNQDNRGIGTLIDKNKFDNIDMSIYGDVNEEVANLIKTIISSYVVEATFSSNPKSISYLENNKLICDQSQFVLDVNGDIYAKGDNEFGKLGIGSSDATIDSWEKINFANLITKTNIHEIISCIEDVKRDYFIFNISDNKQYFAGKFGNKNYTAALDLDGVLNTLYPLKESKKFKLSDKYIKSYFDRFKSISGEEFLVCSFDNEIKDLIGIEIIISTNDDIISLTLSGTSSDQINAYANYVVNPKNKIGVSIKRYTTNDDETLIGLFVNITKEKEEITEISNNVIESRITVNNVFGNIVENKEILSENENLYFYKEFEQSNISYFGPINFESKNSVLIPNKPINEFTMIDVNVDIGETKLIINNPDIRSEEYIDKEIKPYEETEFKGPQFLYPIFYNLGIPFNKYVKFEGIISVDGIEYMTSYVMISTPLDSSNKFGVIQFILSENNKLFNNEAISEYEDENEEKSDSIFGITFYPIYENENGKHSYRVINNIPNSIISQNNEMSIIGKKLLKYETEFDEDENTIENLISNSIKRFDNFICIKIDNGIIIIDSLTGKTIQKFTSLSLFNENTNNFTIHINDNNGSKEFAIKYNNQYLILSEIDEGEFVTNEFIESINEIESDDFVFTDLSDNNDYIDKYKIKENEYCYEISFDDIKFIYKREINDIDLYLYKDHMVNNSKYNNTENVHIVPSIVQSIDGVLLIDNKDIRIGYPKIINLK